MSSEPRGGGTLDLENSPRTHTEVQAEGRVPFPDLGATVYPGGVPDGLTRSLPELYSSCFSVPEYFAIYERAPLLHACVVDNPPHIVVYTRRGATGRVLNRRIAIDASATDRVVEAVFRAHPELRRLELEAEADPDRLTRPVRVLRQSDDLVVDLPVTVGEYEARLGKATRKHLRHNRNRMRRDHPDFEMRVLEGDDITLALVKQVFAWNRERIRAKGEPWAYEKDPQAPFRLWRLLRSRGTAIVGRADGTDVAGELMFFVGADCWMHTGANHPDYDALGLGLVMVEAGIAESIRRRCRRTHLLWGTTSYKERLGARPVPAYRMSIFRTSLNRRLYSLERWRLLVQDRRDLYWRIGVMWRATRSRVPARTAQGAPTKGAADGPRSTEGARS